VAAEFNGTDPSCDAASIAARAFDPCSGRIAEIARAAEPVTYARGRAARTRTSGASRRTPVFGVVSFAHIETI